MKQTRTDVLYVRGLVALILAATSVDAIGARIEINSVAHDNRWHVYHCNMAAAVDCIAKCNDNGHEMIQNSASMSMPSTVLIQCLPTKLEEYIHVWNVQRSVYRAMNGLSLTRWTGDGYETKTGTTASSVLAPEMQANNSFNDIMRGTWCKP